MLGALLDRSVARIAGLLADGRHFDRLEVVRTSDVWDNNTYPFFAVALTRRPWLRERRARTALRWMGAARSEWMTSLAGEPVERFLGPRPTLTDVLDPPDLTGTVITSFQIERTGPTLTAFLGCGSADVRLDDVKAFRFDSTDTAGVTLSGDGALRLGVDGFIRAASASYGYHYEPASPSPGRPLVAVAGPAAGAASALVRAMQEIRTVRYAKRVGWFALADLCDTLAGAGTRVLAAARRHGAARDRAFQQLTAEWERPIGVRLPAPATARPPEARLLHAGYHGPESAVILNYTAPDRDGRWTLHAEEIAQPHRLVLTDDAFA
jgi:hypothetical protein